MCLGNTDSQNVVRIIQVGMVKSYSILLSVFFSSALDIKFTSMLPGYSVARTLLDFVSRIVDFNDYSPNNEIFFE